MPFPCVGSTFGFGAAVGVFLGASVGVALVSPFFGTPFPFVAGVVGVAAGFTVVGFLSASGSGTPFPFVGWVVGP